MWAPDPVELHKADQEAVAAILAIQVSLCTGDELFAALTKTIGYGGSDEKFRTFVRTIQKHLERCPG